MNTVNLAALQLAEKLVTKPSSEEIDIDQLFIKMHDEIDSIIKSIGSNIICTNKSNDSTSDYYELYIQDEGLKYKRFQSDSKSIVVLSFTQKSISVNNQPVPVDYLMDFTCRISEVVRDIKSGDAKVRERTE